MGNPDSNKLGFLSCIKLVFSIWDAHAYLRQKTWGIPMPMPHHIIRSFASQT